MCVLCVKYIVIAIITPSPPHMYCIIFEPYQDQMVNMQFGKLVNNTSSFFVFAYQCDWHDLNTNSWPYW